MPPATRRPTSLAALACLAVLVAAAACSGTGTAPAAAPTEAARATVPADRTAITALLDRQRRALLDHDQAGYLATIDPAQAAYRRQATQIFDNLARLPLADWKLALDPVQPVAPRPGGDTLRLTLTYRYAGYDDGDATATRYLTFARHPAGWLVEGDGTTAGLSDDAQIWAQGPITVVRGRRSLVIGDGTGRPARLTAIGRRLDRAVPAVSSVVGDGWAGRVVALAPATEDEVHALLGTGTATTDIAALAAVVQGQDRIIIDPESFGELNALGVRVVLTHETTHIATDAPADSRTPLWLVEGLADYVGYKGTGTPVAVAAKELAADVRAGRMPSELPAAARFAAGSAGVAQAYEQAWLACRMVAERYGEPALMRLYRSRGDSSAALGVSTAAFTAMWRTYLRARLT